MILALVFAHVCAVVQLIVLGSLARTVRARTVFAGFAVGLYACAPLTALLQVAWTRPAAWMFGVSIDSMVGTASYTFDPFLEEILKVVPLALLLVIPVIRRQWSLTDCVLIGAATGAGFGLAEELLRFNGIANGAHPVSNGWAAVRSNGAVLWVPAYLTSLASWLPDGISSLSDGIRVNAHLAWSAAGGLALGFVALRRKREAWVAAVVVFVLVGLDHAASNAANLPSLSYIRALASLRGVMPVAALAAAWWLDRPRQRSADPELLLIVERPPGSRSLAILRAAVSRPPWSMLWIDEFVRRRRACNTSRLVAPRESAGVFAAVLSDRARLDRDLVQAGPLHSAGPAWTLNALREAVRKPAVIAWLVLMAPSALWFVVGGWPATARIQAAMTGTAAWKLVWVLSLGMHAWVAWSIVTRTRAWPGTLRRPFGDDVAIAGMRIACAVGSVGLGGFALLRTLGGLSPRAGLLDSAHVAEAAAAATPGGAAMVANAGGGLAAPPSVNDSHRPDVDGAAAAGAAPGDAEGAAATDDQGGPDDGPEASDEPTDLGELDDPKPSTRAPKLPDEAELARARADKAADDALEAEADALEAEQRRLRAMRAADAADIARTIDPESDPIVNDVRELARQAHDKADKADIASDGLDDPWDPGPAKAARDESRVADEDVEAAKQAVRDRRAAEASAAAEAARQAEAESTAAAAAAANARDAAHIAARSAARAADPNRAAADDAAAEYAAAQQHANQLFMDENATSEAYRSALDAAARARQRADAARATADASRGSKSDKP